MSPIGINRACRLEGHGCFLASVDLVSTADTLQKDGPRSGQRTAEAVAPDRPRPARDPFFDNAKFLLIVLVVVGHNWFPLIGHSRAVKAAYMVVYAFHMPAFILLSGYFSRNFEARPDQVRKLVKTVLLPYFIFQLMYLVVVAKTDGTPVNLDLTHPSYLLWFLMALFVWRLTTPLWRAVPRPVLAAAVVSVCAGLMNPTLYFSLGRILEFLPWFVAGLMMRPEHFGWLRRPATRAWAGVVAALALPAAYLIAPSANVAWLDNEWGRGYLHAGVVEYIGVRVALFAVSAVLVGAALALIPGRRVWFTALGAVTMYPYLLHGMIVKVAEWYGVHDKVINGGPFAVVTLTVGAVALAVLLTTPPVRKLAGWAVEPRIPHRRGHPADAPAGT
jgi:fucose 4-O-acetylase-like acetyltransferase